MKFKRIEFADCCLDLDSLELTRGGEIQAIEPQVFDLIRYFAESDRRLLSRDDLIDGVWGGRIVSDAAISTRINMARKALGDDGKAQRIIKTVPRRGFRFVPEATTNASEEPPAAASAAQGSGRNQPLPSRPSIVVMPIESISDSAETRHLAQGLRIDIQNALVKASGLFLIAAGSASAVGQHSAKEAAQILGVQYVLQGQVRRSGNLVRYTAQLVDAVAGTIVWSEQYDRQFSEAFEFLDNVVSDVLTSMNVKLVSGEEARIWHKTLSDLKSLEVFYRGIENFFLMTKDSLKSARRDFERVALYHPDLALGPTWVALTFWYEYQRGWADSLEDAHLQARDWAEKAVECEDFDGQAHTVLSHVYLMEKEFDKALEAGRIAVQSRPNCAHANGFFANVLHYCGKDTEALRHINLAIRYAPMHPPLFDSILAAVSRACGALDDAKKVAETALRSKPTDLATIAILAVLSSEQGQRQLAADYFKQLLAIDPKFSPSQYAEHQPYRERSTVRDIARQLEFAAKEYLKQ
ncbi:MAG: winged helix-turn-helix domain-containing protein [Paracoccaceae bacterium]|nr:winged helix-turn-helix domain-containing protein [Paracoccaceae bacterium]